MLTASNDRVTSQTDAQVNERIRRDTEARLCYLGAHRDRIDDRLAELDREWDIERTLETVSSSLTLTGLVCSMTRGRRWLLLPLVVQGFFLQHALQGWCPPLPVLRRLGLRTEREIEQERQELLRLKREQRAPQGDASQAERHAKPGGRL